MSQFTDAKGKAWTLDINVDSLDEVYKQTNVSLALLFDDNAKPMAELLGNLPVLANVCYILADAQTAGVSQRDFAKAIKGDVIEAMTTAFLRELTLFFPDARRRAAIEKMMSIWKSMETTAMGRAEVELAKIDPQQLADAALTKMLLTTSTNLPDMSEFTQGG